MRSTLILSGDDRLIITGCLVTRAIKIKKEKVGKGTRHKHIKGYIRPVKETLQISYRKRNKVLT